jgi:hypothetical protein
MPSKSLLPKPPGKKTRKPETKTTDGVAPPHASPSPGVPGENVAEQARAAGLVQTAHIADLKFDDHNPRTHNPYNIGLIQDSLQTLGTGRSILIDEDNQIIAGNGTVEAAGQAEITDVLIVEARPDQLVAVRRRGMTPAQKTAMKVVDNRATETSGWDASILREYRDSGVELQSFGFSDLDLQRLLAEKPPENFLGPDGQPSSADQAQANAAAARPDKITFGVTLTPEQNEIVFAAINAAKREAPELDTAQALAHVCEEFTSQARSGGESEASEEK